MRTGHRASTIASAAQMRHRDRSVQNGNPQFPTRLAARCRTACSVCHTCSSLPLFCPGSRPAAPSPSRSRRTTLAFVVLAATSAPRPLSGLGRGRGQTRRPTPLRPRSGKVPCPPNGRCDVRSDGQTCYSRARPPMSQQMFESRWVGPPRPASHSDSPSSQSHPDISHLAIARLLSQALLGPRLHVVIQSIPVLTIRFILLLPAFNREAETTVTSSLSWFT
ncbi:hypothetical protein BC628DRAFT_398284 [Trametes gibbosa]|nr:hypothetical protein BC628DRAFT_398284 [Trametes gibbosa]